MSWLVRLSTTGSLADIPRSGRPPKVAAAATYAAATPYKTSDVKDPVGMAAAVMKVPVFAERHGQGHGLSRTRTWALARV